MDKNIFLLWLQGWKNAPWLQQQVLNSWQINNPNWNLILLDFNNLSEYVNDINYIYDSLKEISPQAKSDIIRLSVLKNHGGVWADSPHHSQHKAMGTLTNRFAHPKSAPHTLQ